MPKLLPYRIFLETFRYVPRLAVSLVIRNRQGAVLLTQRAIPPLLGYWHLPGGFLLRGEKIQQCIQRIFQRELNSRPPKTKPKFCGAFENLHGDPRGHVVDLVYEIKLLRNLDVGKNRETQEMKYFHKLPRRIGFNHGKTLRKIGVG